MAEINNNDIIITRHAGFRYTHDGLLSIEDHVCKEEVFRIYLNDEPVVGLSASPSQLEQLGAGFVICEGLAKEVEDVRISGQDIRVFAKPLNRSSRNNTSLNDDMIGARRAPSGFKITREDVFRSISELQSDVWIKTGGVHCSVLLHNGDIVARGLDIGRHNTVAKVIGFALLKHIDLLECAIVCTGRQSGEMVLRAVNAGIPIVISKAPATDKGIILADETGITLICFAREDRFTVYTHPERMQG